MTKLKIKEDVGNGNPVTCNFDFDGIENGDMFYCYDSDVLIMIVSENSDQSAFIDLSSCERMPDSKNEHVEDVFQRITEEYGDFYPVSKAKIKFKVGE
ncbi:hypothetical protein D3C87_325340 [compost metagenome]